MNKELKELNAPATLEQETDSLISDWYSYAGYLHTDPASTAFLKATITGLISSKLQAEPAKQETFTARDARSAVCKVRTCEGFIQNILDDLKYKAECGITEIRVTAYWNEYKYNYMQQLIDTLRNLHFDVVYTSRRETRQNRIQVLIRW